jgi:hypothetical protein
LLGHSNTCVSKNKSIGGSVWNYFNFEGEGSSWMISGSVRDLYLILSRASEALEINSLKENFFVGVKGVDDQTHKLLDISIESKMLDACVLSHCNI